VPHGVDTTRFTPAADRAAAWANLGYGGQYGIGIVGRIRPEKGTDLFVDAMIRVLPQRPDFTAIIIGRTMPSDAAFAADLRNRTQAAGLSNRILFVGEHPPQEMPRIIRSLSLLVAPARYEGYGMTPLEAMASGVPVVASDTGVYGEIIHSQVGHVVPIENLDALTIALMEITQSSGKLAEMSQSARKTAVDKLSLRSEAAGYSRLLDQIWQGATFC